MYYTVWIVTLILIAFPTNLTAAEIQAREISGVEDVTGNLGSAWRAGDYLIGDSELRAIIGKSHRRHGISYGNYKLDSTLGTIIGVGPTVEPGGEAAIGAPRITLDGKRVYVGYESIRPKKGTNADAPSQFVAEGYVREDGTKKISLKTTYTFKSGAGEIDIVSRIQNTADTKVAVKYGLAAEFDQSYSFRVSDKKRRGGLSIIVYPKERYALGWLTFEKTRKSSKKPKSVELKPKESYDVKYKLLIKENARALLEAFHKRSRTKVAALSVELKNYGGGDVEIVVRDSLTNSVCYRYFGALQNEAPSLEIPLPDGRYVVHANFFPSSDEKHFTVEKSASKTVSLRNSDHGAIRLSLQDAGGNHLPGKVSFIGVGGTENPYFQPLSPIGSGRGFEKWKNSKYPPKEGLDVDLPVGTYLVTASYGPEFTRDQRVVEVLLGETYEVNMNLNRVVDASRFVSIDPHMHTIHSDGTVNIEERIRSVVAEGVDVAIATDHNILIDYSPAIERLGLADELTAIVGNEITVGGLIHFNAFPLPYRKNEINNGAIYPVSDGATALFEANRKQSSETIIQLNHPRYGSLGYFNNLGLDPETAGFANEGFDASFDVLESVNGPRLNPPNEDAIRDWLNLTNRGYFRPLVGSSDSHSIDGNEPGYSRTYVYYEGKKGRNLNTSAVLSALKQGRSFVSNAPILHLTVNQKHIPGDTIKATDGRVSVRLKVECAPWVSLNEMVVLINGERELVFPIDPKSKKSVRLERKIIMYLERDSSLIAGVSGRRSLFPVVQRKSSNGLFENAAVPYALTNPVFVDVDGNGVFDPPLPKKFSTEK